MKIISQSLALILSFALVFIWQHTPLTDYTVQLLGFLIFLYLITSVRKKGISLAITSRNESRTILILNAVIFLLIFSTDGLSSSLFFLLYFLVFGIAFVFEPATVFVFVGGTFVIFLPDALKNDLLNNFLKTGSLLLISPLAFFFGREYRESDVAQNHIKTLEEKSKESADTIAKDIGEILKNEKKKLKTEDVEKLNDILEETETLREETKK